MVLRCGATFQCPHRSRQQHSSFSSTCSFGHLQVISQTVLGICGNRAWGWSITSGIFLFKAGCSTGQFGTGWWQGWKGTSIPGCCLVWKAETNLALSSLPPLPLQDRGQQLEGTGWWERQQDPPVDPGKRRGWGITMAWVGYLSKADRD